jgi:hypothetical protein
VGGSGGISTANYLQIIVTVSFPMTCFKSCFCNVCLHITVIVKLEKSNATHGYDKSYKIEDQFCQDLCL